MKAVLSSQASCLPKPQKDSAPTQRGAFRFNGREAVFETTEDLAWARLTALLDLPREACKGEGPSFRLWRQDHVYRVQFGEGTEALASSDVLQSASGARDGVGFLSILPQLVPLSEGFYR